MNSRIRELKDKWKKDVVDREIERFPEQKEVFTTNSGIPIKRLYTPSDTEGIDYLDDLGFPGQHPFTRGAHTTMYRGRPWTIRQFSGYGIPEESNRRLKYLIGHGETGLSIAFDMPTHHGLNSNNAMARGEVGKVGVPIDSAEDMAALFDGIPLDKVSTSLVCGFPPLMSFYILAARQSGIDPARLRGTLQNDVFTYSAGAFILSVPIRGSFKLSLDVIEYCARHLPLWYPVSIVGYQIREKGCTAVQELAFTLASGVAYVKALVERDLDVDAFGPRLSFMFNSHMDFFEEICKYRAARRMWARIMKDRFKAKDPRSCMLRFHTQTAGCSLTAQQPYNNIIRTTVQALAAALGGTQSLHTNSFDEALALPTEESVEVALRTQQIVNLETGVTRTVDPLGGSYFVESMTRDIEEEAMVILDKIEEMGGAVAAMENGYILNEIMNSANRNQEMIDSGEIKVVGVNELTREAKPHEKEINLLKIDPEFEMRQTRKVEELIEKRDGDAAKAALDELREAAERGENLMEGTIKAGAVKASLEEIWDVYREVLGSEVDHTIMVGGLAGAAEDC
ncbi:methylmalonyl-CoA mutase [Thermodesulfobacteriota bacterium]